MDGVGWGSPLLAGNWLRLFCGCGSGGLCDFASAGCVSAISRITNIARRFVIPSPLQKCPRGVAIVIADLELGNMVRHIIAAAHSSNN